MTNEDEVLTMTTFPREPLVPQSCAANKFRLDDSMFSLLSFYPSIRCVDDIKPVRTRTAEFEC